MVQNPLDHDMEWDHLLTHSNNPDWSTILARELNTTVPPILGFPQLTPQDFRPAVYTLQSTVGLEGGSRGHRIFLAGNQLYER